MPVDHYENFPVASILLPPRLRSAVHDIYRFARAADDIADEGDAADHDRLAVLSRFQRELDAIEQGRPGADAAADDVGDVSAIFMPLAATIARHDLPLAPFRRLLDAFAQDVRVKRYDDYAALRDYSHRSADPVGELMLRLYDAATERNLQDSDAICTGLQLANFWQDVAVDWGKGRIYLPREDMARCGVAEDDIAAARCDDRWRALMTFEVERTRALLHSGAPLAARLPGRIGWELRLVVQGGLRILERIESCGFDVFRARPTLGKPDLPIMLWRALRMPRHIPASAYQP